MPGRSGWACARPARLRATMRQHLAPPVPSRQTPRSQRKPQNRRRIAMSSATLQEEHYEKDFFEEYERHYDDTCSQRYRNELVYDPLFAGQQLAGADVLEAMCGSGQATTYLLRQGARVTGLDLSQAAIASFSRRWPQARGVCASITESGLPSESFDAAVVIGGLHHLHPNVEDGIRENRPGPTARRALLLRRAARRLAPGSCAQTLVQTRQVLRVQRGVNRHSGSRAAVRRNVRRRS